MAVIFAVLVARWAVVANLFKNSRDLDFTEFRCLHAKYPISYEKIILFKPIIFRRITVHSRSPYLR